MTFREVIEWLADTGEIGTAEQVSYFSKKDLAEHAEKMMKDLDKSAL